jgi:hypothetical protein
MQGSNAGTDRFEKMSTLAPTRRQPRAIRRRAQMTYVETLLRTSSSQRSILRLRNPSTSARLPKLRLHWRNRLRESAEYDVVDRVELHADE